MAFDTTMRLSRSELLPTPVVFRLGEPMAWDVVVIEMEPGTSGCDWIPWTISSAKLWGHSYLNTVTLCVPQTTAPPGRLGCPFNPTLSFFADMTGPAQLHLPLQPLAPADREHTCRA
jgi:hypothetical protein